MKAFVFIILIAALGSFLLTPVALWLARRGKVYAPLRARDVHKVPTPRLGGLAILGGVLLGFGVASAIPFFSSTFNNLQAPLGVIAAGIFVCLLGFADDLWDLDWMTKLAGQIVAAGILAWSGVQLVSLPVGGLTVGSSQMSLVLTVFVVVLTMNAINFIDGLDGLAAGVVAISGTAFFAYSYLFTRQTNPEDYSSLASLILAALIGACVGFLPHNFHPAKIFMGDSGSMLIGLLLSASTIAVTGQVDPASVDEQDIIPAFMPVLIPIAVLLLPVADLVMAVFRRLKAGKSPFSPDRKHLHHRLLDLGYSHPHAVILLYVWTSVLAFGSVFFAYLPLWIVLVVDAVLLALALFATFGPWLQRRRSLTGGPQDT